MFEADDTCDECVCDVAPAEPDPLPCDPVPKHFLDDDTEYEDECNGNPKNAFSKLHTQLKEPLEFDPMNPSGDVSSYSFRIITQRFKDSSHEFTGINDCQAKVDPFPFDTFDDAFKRMVALSHQYAEEAINYELSSCQRSNCGLMMKLWHPQIEYPSPCIAIAGWKNKLKKETHTIAILQIIKV